MSTKVQKWGNSLAVRLPKTVATRSHLREGSSVRMIQRGRNIVITAIPKKRLTIHELVKNIKPKNLHQETGWGKPRGNEVW